MYPIPANATRIRYLQSGASAARIDTGVSPNGASVRIAGSIGITQNAYNVYFLGVSDGTNMCNMTGSYSRKAYFVCGTDGASTTAVGNISYPLNTLFGFDVSANPATGAIGGTINGTSKSGSFPGSTPSTNIYIFGINNNGSHNYGKTIYLCGALSIWVGGTLVRSYVPVRVGQTGYLFDRVSGQLFGNAGTGDFVLGPDTFSQGVVPTRMIPMGVRKRPYDALYDRVTGTVFRSATSTPLVAGPDENGGAA